MIESAVISGMSGSHPSRLASSTRAGVMNPGGIVTTSKVEEMYTSPSVKSASVRAFLSVRMREMSARENVVEVAQAGTIVGTSQAQISSCSRSESLHVQVITGNCNDEAWTFSPLCIGKPAGRATSPAEPVSLLRIRIPHGRWRFTRERIEALFREGWMSRVDAPGGWKNIARE